MLRALQSPEKLGTESRIALQSRENSIHVSPVSFWEISLKFAMGKLRIEGATPVELPGFVARAGWNILELQAPQPPRFMACQSFSVTRIPLIIF